MRLSNIDQGVGRNSFSENCQVQQEVLVNIACKILDVSVYREDFVGTCSCCLLCCCPVELHRSADKCLQEMAVSSLRSLSSVQN